MEVIPRELRTERRPGRGETKHENLLEDGMYPILTYVHTELSKLIYYII